jgi:hypothetical protein
LQNDLVTYVDLSGETVLETVPIAVASGSIALSASGIYAFPDSQGGPAYLVFAWGPFFGTANLAQAGSARFDNALNAVFGIRNDFYPGRLFEIDVSYGYPSSITQGPDTGACGNHNLWL